MVLFPELKRDLQKWLAWQVTGAVLEAVGRKDESKVSSSCLEMHKALWAGLASHGCNDTEALPLSCLWVSYLYCLLGCV